MNRNSIFLLLLLVFSLGQVCSAETLKWGGFSQFNYTTEDHEAFLEDYRGSPHLAEKIIAVTKEGRTVELLRVGRIDGEAKYKLLLTNRQHPAEWKGHYVLEGMIQMICDPENEEGAWFRENVEIAIVPFVNKDNAEKPYWWRGDCDHFDYNRSWVMDPPELKAPAIIAIKKFIHRWHDNKLNMALDFHSPNRDGGGGDGYAIYMAMNNSLERHILEANAYVDQIKKIQRSPMFLEETRTYSNHKEGQFRKFAQRLPGMRMTATVEIHENTITAEEARLYGRDLLIGYKGWIEEKLPDGLAISYANTVNPESMNFPLEDWAIDEPQSLGINNGKLREAVEILGSDALEDTLVIRRGIVVHEGSQAGKAKDIGVITHAFMSAAVGFLMDEGRCNPNSIARYFERFLPNESKGTRIKHLLNMTSGWYFDENTISELEHKTYDDRVFEIVTHDTSERFCYSKDSMLLLSRVLTHVVVTDLDQYLRGKLHPLGMGDWNWTHENVKTKRDWYWKNNDGGETIVYPGAYGLSMSAKQLAKFGHLYLNRGVWHDQWVLNKRWVDVSTTNQVKEDIPLCSSEVDGRGQYGYGWFLQKGNGLIKDAPKGTLYTGDFAGKDLFVIPEMEMVVVRLGNDENVDTNKYNEFFKLLQESMAQRVPFSHGD